MTEGFAIRQVSGHLPDQSSAGIADFVMDYGTVIRLLLTYSHVKWIVAYEQPHVYPSQAVAPVRTASSNSKSLARLMYPNPWDLGSGNSQLREAMRRLNVVAKQGMISRLAF